MGAKCTTVEKLPGEDRGDEQTKLQQCCQQRFRCCKPEATVPVQSVSALKGKDTAQKEQRRQSLSEAANQCSRESTFSTQPKAGVVPFRPMRIDEIRVEKQFKKVRRLASEVVGELIHFRVFLKRSFESLEVAYSALVDTDSNEGDFDTFISNLAKHGYTGQGERVFYALCCYPKHYYTEAEALVIKRKRFLLRLQNMPTPFRMAVRLVIARDRFKISINVERKLAASVDAFRELIAKQYPSPSDAFDAIAGDVEFIDEDKIVQCLDGISIPSSSKHVFQCLCDARGQVTRQSFTDVFLNGTKLVFPGPESAAQAQNVAPSSKRSTSKRSCTGAPDEDPVALRAGTGGQSDDDGSVGSAEEPKAKSKPKAKARRSSKEKGLRKSSSADDVPQLQVEAEEPLQRNDPKKGSKKSTKPSKLTRHNSM